MSLVLFQNLSCIETLFDEQNQPWFKRADLGKYLEIADVRGSQRNLNGATKLRSSFNKSSHVLNTWLDRSYNPHDVFLDLDASLEICIRSKKTKAIALTKFLVNKGVKRVVEEHQKAIEDKNTLLSNKSLEIALLNDDIEDQDQRILELQNNVQELEGRVVHQLENRNKMNSMCIIQKNNNDEFPYIAICGQQEYVAQKIQNKLADYADGQLVVLAETPNAIIHYNWLRERGCIEINPCRVRHFRLGERYTHQQLLQLEEA